MVKVDIIQCTRKDTHLPDFRILVESVKFYLNIPYIYFF